MWFRASLERVSEGNRKATLVFYCVVDCWMSWNATKRAIAWGYEAALWYADGNDGWEVAGFPLAEATSSLDQPEWRPAFTASRLSPDRRQRPADPIAEPAHNARDGPRAAPDCRRRSASSAARSRKPE
jgi:hypothetical protein